MSSITLLPLQAQQAEETRQRFSKHRSILLQAPTGFGKTVLASWIVKESTKKNNRVYFSVHRRELITQTSETFKKFDIDHGFIAANERMNLVPKAQICSMQTLQNRADKLPVPDFLLIDEAHHSTAHGWVSLIEKYRQRGVTILGLSATPHRLDGGGLDHIYSDLVLGPTPAELIRLGYLADYDYIGPDVPDLRDAPTNRSDYQKTYIEEIMEKPSIMGSIIDHWREFAYEKRTIAFFPSVYLSEKYAREFNKAGIPALHLDGTTKNKVRANAAKRFATGDIQILTNVELFGEGYDLSAQANMPVTIDAAILGRPTQSLVLFLQQVGRPLRKKADGSKAILLDHVGNWMRHGFPDDDRQWTLEGNRQTKKERAESVPRAVRCPECFTVQRPSIECKKCGHQFSTTPRVIREIPGKLKKLDVEKQRLRRSQAQANDLESLMDIGNSEARARKILEAREKKSELRNELIKLVNETGVKMTVAEIKAMKPKRLAEEIDRLKEVSNQIGHQEFFDYGRG